MIKNFCIDQMFKNFVFWGKNRAKWPKNGQNGRKTGIFTTINVFFTQKFFENLIRTKVFNHFLLQFGQISSLYHFLCSTSIQKHKIGYIAILSRDFKLRDPFFRKNGPIFGKILTISKLLRFLMVYYLDFYKLTYKIMIYTLFGI